MKYKYVGEDGSFCIELLAYNLVPKGSYLKKGQVIDVPDDLTRVTNALSISGVFEEVKVDKKSTKKVKREDKE